MNLTKTPFGSTDDHRPTSRYTCTNVHGMSLSVTDWGATVLAVEVPDRDGICANVVLGFPDPAQYLRSGPYFGSTVGRVCNRIANGRFTLDGQTYVLARNDGPHHLHGGSIGFDRVLWSATPLQSTQSVGVAFDYDSPHEEEGYPGTLNVRATYLLTDQNELRMEFSAATDAPTHVNLTNHCYWNLAGAGSGTILEHELEISADHYLPVDETLIPTGEIAPVEGTPLDFTTATPLGKQLARVTAEPPGYDHCFVVQSGSERLRPAARAYEPGTGRVMQVRTTQPGLQLYTGNFLDGTEATGGHRRHTGFCLETQRFPDAPNQPEFASTLLNPGQTYHEITIHAFKTTDNKI